MGSGTYAFAWLFQAGGGQEWGWQRLVKAEQGFQEVCHALRRLGGTMPEQLPAEPSLTKLLSKKKAKAIQPPRAPLQFHHHHGPCGTTTPSVFFAPALSSP